MRVDPNASAGVHTDPGECRSDGPVTSRSIGRLQVSQVSARGTQVLRRTPANVAVGARPRFTLIRMRTGQAWLHHAGGEIPLGPDDCVLLDEREPSEILLRQGSESLWFHLPIDWVEGYLPDPRVATAVPLGARQPWGDLLRDVIDAIHDDHSSSPLLVSRCLCSALALAVDDAHGLRSTAHSRKTFQSLQRTLARLASTCNVTVAQIAQAHGISPRYVHAIYAANGTSCRRELIRLRLEHARRLLRDPQASGCSIDEIAWQCGFSDAGHFRRRFRALFGVSPSAMRAEGFSGQNA
jgi:AraC family transcriptional activator of tynA and feaB